MWHDESVSGAMVIIILQYASVLNQVVYFTFNTMMYANCIAVKLEINKTSF